MDIAAEEESPVSVVDTKLRIAVEMTRFQHAGGCPTGECAGLALGRQEVLAELTLASADPDDFELVALGEEEVRRAVSDSPQGTNGAPIGQCCDEGVPTQRSHAELALG